MLSNKHPVIALSEGHGHLFATESMTLSNILEAMHTREMRCYCRLAPHIDGTSRAGIVDASLGSISTSCMGSFGGGGGILPPWR